MLNKQSLILLTLTSLILVLSVYYITMPNELLIATSNSYIPQDNEEIKTNIKSGTIIESMKSVLVDERQELVKELNDKLLDKSLSIEEKNNVYEEIKMINKIEIMENDIENKVKKAFNYDNFVTVKDDVIEIVVNNLKHDTNLAVKIMNKIKKDYPNMYISVSFKG